jgi:hypothetical protein
MSSILHSEFFTLRFPDGFLTAPDGSPDGLLSKKPRTTNREAVVSYWATDSWRTREVKNRAPDGLTGKSYPHSPPIPVPDCQQFPQFQFTDSLTDPPRKAGFADPELHSLPSGVIRSNPQLCASSTPDCSGFTTPIPQ